MAGSSVQLSSRRTLHPEICTALDAVLLAVQSNTSREIDNTLVADLVSKLESEDNFVCRTLDLNVYVAVVQTLLKCHYCRDSERGIYLLGAALYYDAHAVSKSRIVKKKKEVIGKECLDPLLGFFIDGSKNNNMRQWVGILALQLFQDCDINVQILELGPEQQRRGLGNIVLKEPNEILRIISGQLITALLSAGVMPEHLWPLDTDKRLYLIFPTVSLGSRDWNQKFQAYMDNVFEFTEPIDSIGQLFFIQNVSLTPHHDFGPEDHNVVIVIESTKIIIWAGVVVDTQNFNHCLEVPLVMITKMLIKKRPDSQLSGVLNVHFFLEQISQVCCLDCVDTSLTQICMVLQQSVVETIHEELRAICPHLEIINEDGDVPDDFDEPCGEEDSQHMSRSIETVHCNNKGASIVKSHYLPSTEKEFSNVGSTLMTRETGRGVSKAIVKSGIDCSHGLAVGGIASSGLQTKDAARPRPELKIAQESATAGTIEKHVLRERNRARVPQPKAKAPLRQAHKFHPDIVQEPHSTDKILALDGHISKRLSYLERGHSSSKLAVRCLSTDASNRREMVLASNGNSDGAEKPLSKRLRERKLNTKKLNDTLKVNHPLNEPTAKAKRTTVSKSQSPNINKAKPERLAKATERKSKLLEPDLSPLQKIQKRTNPPKGTLKGLQNDHGKGFFDIPFEEVGKMQINNINNELCMGILATEPRRTTGKSVARKQSAKHTKSTNSNQRKRQSAPAEMHRPNNAEAGNRHAVLVVDERLVEAKATGYAHPLSGESETKVLEQFQNDIEFTDPEKQKVHMVIGNSRAPRYDLITTYQQEDQRKDSSLPALVKDDLTGEPSDDPYGASPVKPAASIIHQSDASKSPFDDLYDATPRKVATRLQLTKVETPGENACSPLYARVTKQKCESLGTMATKLSSLLEILDEPDFPEEISPKQGKEQSKMEPRKLGSINCDRAVVNDYFCRKNPVIGFSDKGARNQGHPGMNVRPVGHSNTYTQDELSKPSGITKQEDCKRKRQNASDGENDSPPRKQQSLSPIPNRTPVQSHSDQYFRSSPPVQHQGSILRRADSLYTLQRLSKLSSQGSRVDKNGSPIAMRGPQIDRIGDVKRKLLADDASEIHTPKQIRQGVAFTTVSPEIFGPKIRLESIPKERPSSSSEEVAPRYVPHKKTWNGQYEDIDTNEIIEPEKVLVDPFIEKVLRPTSGFSDRLLVGSSSASERSKKSTKGTHQNTLDRIDKNIKHLPTNLTKTKVVNRFTNCRPSKGLTAVFLDEDEATLVESGNRSSSEMPTNTTHESRSPLADKSKAWSIAVRPHYANLSETIHNIADEVIIRLADEEDAMKLIANQYKENGEKLLHRTTETRKDEKAIMMREIGQRMGEMVALYTDARGLADRTKKGLKRSPLSTLEKEYKTRGEALQVQIDKGKMGPEEEN